MGHCRIIGLLPEKLLLAQFLPGSCEFLCQAMCELSDGCICCQADAIYWSDPLDVPAPKSIYSLAAKPWSLELSGVGIADELGSVHVILVCMGSACCKSMQYTDSETSQQAWQPT